MNLFYHEFPKNTNFYITRIYYIKHTNYRSISLNSDNHINHLTIGMRAPDFEAQTTFGVKRMTDYAGKWLVFFSHPGDFTPVCTTEFIAFASNYPNFLKLNTELLGLSIDSNPSHLAWVYNIYLTNNIQIPFPIVADRVGEVARLYGMIAPDVSAISTIRSVFIIDPEQIIRAIISYPATTGRNIPEILRLLQALQATDQYNVVTPANWTPGNPALVPPPKSFEELMHRTKHSEEENLVCLDWFWCYKDEHK